jgi:hypothetical protein
MQSKYLCASELINEQGGPPILAIITRGIVTIYSDLISFKKHLREWESLGAREFFLQTEPRMHTICQTLTRILYYEQPAFM